MKINANDAADVLTAFIREDRAEARIYRSRVENLTYSIVVASFAISAFLIGRSSQLDTTRLLNLSIDISLIAILLMLFLRINHDLVLLRKAMKWRQDLLHALEEGVIKEINVFANVENVKPDSKDTDLRWIVAVSIGIVMAKTIVFFTYWSAFTPAKGTP